MDNSLAREKMSNLISGRGGRSFDSHGHGRHTMLRENTGPKRRASKAFAKEIARCIISATSDGSCRDFALIAAPHFLGELRDALSIQSSSVPIFSIDKEVVGKDIGFIEKLITDV